jgi:hypothetical protein
MRGCGNRGAAGSYLKQNYEMLAERARGLLSGEVSRLDKHETRPSGYRPHTQGR